MKRWIQIATLLLAAADVTMTTGCRKPEMQRCVDQQNIVVDDDLCHATGEQRILGKKPIERTSYRYYYGGSGSTEAGTLATGGSYLPERNQTYAVAQRERVRLKKDLWPAVGVVVVVALLLFAWEGRRGRA
ncbi:MAG TPA: hypothetical protein VGG95_11955 [Edaphobacter sp.]|jgi:hypothetical protein